MSKYLELVEGSFTQEHFNKQKNQNPYVAYSIQDDKVIYSIIPEPVVNGPWVTFTAEEDNSSIGLVRLSTNQILEYSTDTNAWNAFDTTTNIPLNNGDKVYVRGILSADNTSSKYTQFKMSGKIAASGNCNALWNYEDLEAPLKSYCGSYMFQNCTSLTAAPELPATELTERCYAYMFQNCTSLTTAPELPATTLHIKCYFCMFDSCTSLATAPKILPATRVNDTCYARMFQNCTSLTTAPELPATALSGGAGWACYQSMFAGCTSLNYIKCLAIYTTAKNCTNGWVDGVSSTGVFVKHPNKSDWTTGTSGIPSGWTVEDAVL